MDTSIHQPSKDKGVAEVRPLPADAGATSDVEHGYHHDFKDAVIVIETAHRSESGAGGCLGAVFTLGMGVLIFGVGLAQALVASHIKGKEIEVRGAWVLGYSYPMAGDPSIGFLALSIGAIFVFISSLAIVYTKYEDRRLAGFILPVATICALLSALLIFVKSFGERAVYIALNINDECIHTTAGSESPRRNDCLCWTGDVDREDMSSENSSSGAVDFLSVNIASDAGMACDRILEYVGDIRSSYLLMVVSNLLLIVLVVVLLVRFRLQQLRFQN